MTIPNWVNWKSIDRDGTVSYWASKPVAFKNHFLGDKKITLEEREILNPFQLEHWPNGMLRRVTPEVAPKYEFYLVKDKLFTSYEEAIKSAEDTVKNTGTSVEISGVSLKKLANVQPVIKTFIQQL